MLAYVILGTNDLTRAIPFYTQLLIEQGIDFYTQAGLGATVDSGRAEFRCEGRDRPSLILIGGVSRKRLHHITLLADDIDMMARNALAAGGAIIAPPVGFRSEGVWLSDPHGMVIHLVDVPTERVVPSHQIFEINGPGHVVRTSRSAMFPSASYGAAKPLRLGHVMLFSPDVPASVAFMTGALGMGLADHAQDVIAFCCARQNSDHHVVAFAKSSGIGFHHASFEVPDPDWVGRGGRALADLAGRGDWGFGRHTIGSNFFHYVQDPWGSWFEYYSDMDFIDDYGGWTPTNYGMEDSLANWGPAVPGDFVRNYEVEAEQI